MVRIESRNGFIHSINNPQICQGSLDYNMIKKNSGSQCLKTINVSFWFIVQVDQRMSEKLSAQQKSLRKPEPRKLSKKPASSVIAPEGRKNTNN